MNRAYTLFPVISAPLPVIVLSNIYQRPGLNLTSLRTCLAIIMRSTTANSSSTFTWTLFFISIYLFRSKQRKRIQDDNEKEDDENSKMIENDTISPRGASSLRAKTSYWEGFMKCLQNPCDPQSNPTGYIALCLAENKLVQEALAVRLMQQGTAITAFSDSTAYSYSGFLGLPVARLAVASFLEKRFWKKSLVHDYPQQQQQQQQQHLFGMGEVVRNGDNTNDDRSINPDHVAFGSGVGSILNHLFFIMAQNGDVVLIPAPYYTAFEYDAKAVAGCVAVPVYLENKLLGPSTKDLETALQNAKRVSFNCFL